MGTLAEIAKELYDDGMKEGKTEYIKKLLIKKLKSVPKEKIMMLMEDVSIEKLDEIGDKVLEIDSLEEIEQILEK